MPNPGRAALLRRRCGSNALPLKWLQFFLKRSNLARFLAFSSLVLGVLFQTGISAAQNLVTNPGFETGDTSGWFGFGSPTLTAETSVVHTGSYAALVSNRTVDDSSAGRTAQTSASPLASSMQG